MEYVSFGRSRLAHGSWTAVVTYDIVVDTVSVRGYEYCEDYGIRIVLTPENGPSEEVELLSITPIKSVIEGFLDSFCRNAVTPMSAMDVLEDCLAT